MRERKEYKNRWNAKLVNPCITLEEYEKSRTIPYKHPNCDCGGKTTHSQWCATQEINKWCI